MRFFVLQQNTHVVQVDDYVQRADSDPEFARFLRREALGEILVQPSNDKPGYLRYANRLGFRWEPHAESGQVQYDYKANLMRRLVQDYARQLVHELGMPVYEVNGANMFSLNHPVVEAYASLYGDRLYSLSIWRSYSGHELRCQLPTLQPGSQSAAQLQAAAVCSLFALRLLPARTERRTDVALAATAFLHA